MTYEELLAENEQLHRDILAMAERIAICSELLGNRAERKPVKCWLAGRYLSQKCEVQHAKEKRG